MIWFVLVCVFALGAAVGMFAMLWFALPKDGHFR